MQVLPLSRKECPFSFVLSQTILSLTKFTMKIIIFITLNRYAIKIYFIMNLIKLAGHQKFRTELKGHSLRDGGREYITSCIKTTHSQILARPHQSSIGSMHACISHCPCCNLRVKQASKQICFIYLDQLNLDREGRSFRVLHVLCQPHANIGRLGT